MEVYNEQQMFMNGSLNSFESNATLHYHHFLPLLHITVYLNPSRRVAADDLNVCAPVFMLSPMAMYFSGLTGALAGEHLQICLVIRNTCFSDGPLSMLQIPIFLSLLNSKQDDGLFPY